MKKRRLLIVGIDGAGFDVIGPWIDQGDLPGLGILIKEGFSTDLKSTIPPLSPVAWTSMATGVNPGKHGIYDFWIKNPAKTGETPEFTFATGADRKTKTFWEYLSECDMESIVLNMPCSFPPDPIKGKMISGMDMSQDKSKGFYPERLYKDIMERFGSYHTGPEELISYKDTVQKGEKLSNVFLKMTQKRREIYRHLALNSTWDLFFGVFTESDMALHAFFNSTKDVNNKDGAVFRVFKEIDNFIVDIKKAFQDDIDIMVVSDHGFTWFDTGINLNSFLEQKGFLYKEGLAQFMKLQARKVFQKALRKMKKAGFPIKGKLTGFNPWKEQIDFKKTKIFSQGVYPYFYNLDFLNADQEFERLREEICAIEYKGRKGFKDLLKTDELFTGPYVDTFPDFIGIIEKHFEPGKLGRIDGFFPNSKQDIFSDHVWEGTHDENGIFIFNGETSGKMSASSPIVWDICPTILSLFGIPIPNQMDGRPINEWDTRDQINFSDKNIYKDPLQSGLSGDDARAIEERLKNLGYL